MFECVLPTGKLRELIGRIEKQINSEEDSVRIYRLCSDCENRVRIMGQGKVTEDKDVYIL